MATSEKLDQAILDLIEAYDALEAEAEEKHSEDEEAYGHAIIEGLEAGIESAVDEGDSTTTQFATIISNLSEALEQLDPSAFEEDEMDSSLGTEGGTEGMDDDHDLDDDDLGLDSYDE